MSNITAEAEKIREQVIDFCRRLIQTPSPPGAEARVARIIQEEMQALDFDRVWVDEAGNVIGLLQGGKGPTLMFNCHMDHVDPGDPLQWQVPPYSAEIIDDAIWGRGSVDIKGPLAAQVYGVGLLKKLGLQPAGDVFVTAVVMEEIGGIGTQALLETVRTDVAVVGEPTNLNIARGHRGRVELIARVRGRAAHASAPERGVNPHYDLARFLLAVEKLEMRSSPDFGHSSIAPTLYETDQISANVIPGEAWVHLDYRNIPDETPDEIRTRLEALLSGCLSPRSKGFVVIPKQTFETYTGYIATAPAIFPSFGLPGDHPVVRTARKVLHDAVGLEPSITTWRFATDGGHLMAAGIPTIGFAPGDEQLAHTSDEHIRIADLVTAVAGNCALAQHLTARSAENSDLS